MLGFSVSGALHKVGGIVIIILAVELPQTFSASPDINRLVVETWLQLIAAVAMFEQTQNENGLGVDTAGNCSVSNVTTFFFKRIWCKVHAMKRKVKHVSGIFSNVNGGL